jgi:hypothetical protein
MSTWVWIGIGAIVLAIVTYMTLALSAPQGEGYKVLKGSQPGDKTTQSSASLPRSFNEKEGAVYSWTGWILVKNFATGFGERRRIFSRGDAPGLYIDSTSNSLILVVNTYGGTPETILVSNIPAMKWVHVGIVVDQTAVNIYINGTLRIYHTLSQLPKQVDEQVKFGSRWDGVVGEVDYYPRALTNAEVFLKASQEPPPDLVKKPSSGSYFDMTWYTGRI